MILGPQDVVNNVDNPLRAPVKNHDVHAQRDSTISFRKWRQPALQVLWKWLPPFLQTRRQRSIELQVLLQPWRQVSVALGQSRWQVRIAILIVAANRIAVAHAEYNTPATIVIALV